MSVQGAPVVLLSLLSVDSVFKADWILQLKEMMASHSEDLVIHIPAELKTETLLNFLESLGFISKVFVSERSPKSLSEALGVSTYWEYYTEGFQVVDASSTSVTGVCF